MEDLAILPDRITFNSAIRAVAKDGHWQLALAFLDAMVDDEKLGIEWHVGKPLQFSAAQVTKGLQKSVKRQQQCKEFWVFWFGSCRCCSGIVRELRIDPDATSYNACISACEKSEWEIALHLFESMYQARISLQACFPRYYVFVPWKGIWRNANIAKVVLLLSLRLEQNMRAKKAKKPQVL